MTQCLNLGRTVRRIPVTKHNANVRTLWIRLALQLSSEALPNIAMKLGGPYGGTNLLTNQATARL